MNSKNYFGCYNKVAIKAKGEIMNKKILLLLPALALVLGGCNSKVTPANPSSSDDSGDVAVESVEVAPSEIEIEAGLTAQLAATVKPITVENKDVTWSSNDETVATVDASGIVTGVAGGTAVITATAAADQTKKGTSTVTVVAPIPYIIETTPNLEREYRLGAYQTALAKRYFFSGSVDSGTRGETTDNWADAVKMKFEDAGGGKYLTSFMKGADKKYFEMSDDHHFAVVDTPTAGREWTWDAELKTVTRTINNGTEEEPNNVKYWPGTYGNYSTISGCDESRLEYCINFQFMYLEEVIQPESISIKEENPIVRLDNWTQLSYELLPAGAEGTVVWAVSGNEHVSVDQTGKVTCDGSAEVDSTATVTATCNDLTPASVTVTVKAALSYGTKVAPLTMAEAKAVIDAENPTHKIIYVGGTVKKNTEYSFGYENWGQVWLEGTSYSNGFEGYRLRDTSENNEWGYVFRGNDSLLNKNVVISGYGTIYESNGNKTYETTGDENSKLEVISTAYELATSISSISPATGFEVEQGESEEMSVTYPDGKVGGVNWSVEKVGEADPAKVLVDQHTGVVTVADDAVVGAQYDVTAKLWNNAEVSVTSRFTVKAMDLTKVNLTTKTMKLSGTSYGPNNGDHIVKGITFNTTSMSCATSNAIQCQASKAIILNKTELLKNISTIVLDYNGTASAGKVWKLELANAPFSDEGTEAAETITGTTTASETLTLTPTGNYKYFKLSYTSSNAQYLDAIVINYAA